MPPVSVERAAPAPPSVEAEGTGRCATLPLAPLARATSPQAAPAVAEGEGARAQLRVRADLIDRLVNEAGEVAIARARVEGELRSLKANLLELTGSVIRLRSQVREIEIQADSQIQSRMSMVERGRGRIRSARVRPVHALPGIDARHRRRRQRRLHGAAIAAQESGRSRCGAARAGAAVARRAAAAVLDSHGALREPVRAPVPDPAPNRQGTRQARQSRNPRHPGRTRSVGAGKARRARSSTCCAMRSTMASRVARRGASRASPRPAKSRSPCASRTTKSPSKSRTTAPGST